MRRWCKTMSFFLSGMSVLAGAGTVLSAALFGTLPAHGTMWDETRFVHDPATGLLKKKIYADGHEINYTHTAWGYPKRITYASGKWMERFYNHRLQTVSNVYSSANTPAVQVSPNELGTITRVEDSGGLVYDYGIRPMNQLLTKEKSIYIQYVDESRQ